MRKKKKVHPVSPPAAMPQAQSPFTFSRPSLFAAAAVISLLGFLCYANSLQGRFVWDDELLVRDNPEIRSFSNIPFIFSHNISAGIGEKNNYYRPIQMLSYMAVYSVRKLDVRAYHLLNVLLHILAALSIFWLAWILARDLWISLIAGALFVAHPVHTEAVSYISGTADMLGALFLFLSLIFYLKHGERKKPIALLFASLCFVLSLCSRENGLILPALLILYHFSFRKKWDLPSALSIALIFIAYAVLRLTVLNFPHPNNAGAVALWDRLPGSFAAFGSYLRLLIVPYPLHMEYGVQFFRYSDFPVAAGILLFAVTLFLLYRQKEKRGILFFSLAWFCVTLLPVLNLFPINATMAEHWLYLPSFGIFLLTGKGIYKLYEKQKAVAGVLVMALLSFFSVLTIRQNQYWKDPIPFYLRTLAYNPQSPRVYYNLGNEYRNIDQKQKAIDCYKRAISLNSKYLDAMNNLGTVYQSMGKHDQATELFKKALKINPEFMDSYNNLGNMYATLGKKDDALALYKKAIQISPSNPQVRFNAGLAYYDLGDFPKAAECLLKALELDPVYLDALNTLGIVYLNQGKNKESLQVLEKALRINPRHFDANMNLGKAFLNSGILDSAFFYYKKAISLNPKSGRGYYEMGLAANRLGKTGEAIDLFNQAIKLDPDFPDAYNELGAIFMVRRDYKKASELLNRAVKLRPAFAAAWMNLGTVEAMTGNLLPAVEAFKKAVQADPRYDRAYNNLANVYRTLGKNDDALSAYKKAIELNPGYAEAYSNLADLCFSLGKIREANLYRNKSRTIGIQKPEENIIGDSGR